jgi:cytochrome P450
VALTPGRPVGSGNRILSHAGDRTWLVTRDGPARSVLASEAFTHWRRDEPDGNAFEQVSARWMDAVLPGPEGVLRHDLVARIGEPQIARITAVQDQLADHLLDLALARGGMDIVREFGTPLALVAAGEVLGLDVGEMRTLSHAVCATPGATLEPLAADSGATAGDPLQEVFAEALAGRCRAARGGRASGAAPCDGLLTAIARGVGAQHIGEDDAVPFARLFLFALVDNLVGFLGNAVAALAADPMALESLAATAAPVTDCVDELLRRDGPVEFVRVTARSRVRMSGVDVAAGDDLLVGLAAANRDPHRYDRPGDLVWDRSPSHHLAFGWGRGYCVGARLARREAAVALAALARRVQTMNLYPGGAERRIRPDVLRGWRRLPVELTPRRR